VLQRPQSPGIIRNGATKGQALSIENIAQTVAAGAGYMAKQNGKPVAVGYIGAVKNLEIFALPKVGDVINTKVTVVNQVFDVTIVNGDVECKGIKLAKCEMKIFVKN